MTDVDAGSMLLPVIEEDQFDQADTTRQRKPHEADVATEQSRVDLQQRDIPGQPEHESPSHEHLPSTSVPSSLSALVQADLKQIRECATQPAYK